jgi:hypothetical protein
MKLGTSGPAIVHRVERGGDLLKMQTEVQANGKITRATELEGHRSTTLSMI